MSFDTITRRDFSKIRKKQEALILARSRGKKFYQKPICLKLAPVLIFVVVSLGTYALLNFPSYSASASTGDRNVKGAFTSEKRPSSKVNVMGVEMEKLGLLSTVPVAENGKVTPKVYKKADFDKLYLDAGKKYGVPWQLLAAIHHVESHQSGDSEKASSAGAIGPMQFMPGTFEAYKQDGDGDGKLWVYDVDDAIYSAANMLARNGAGRGNIKGAVFNYNHSNAYVEKVLSYAIGLGLPY